MLSDTLVTVVADHGGWRGTHHFDLPFSAVVDILIFMRGKKYRFANVWKLYVCQCQCLCVYLDVCMIARESRACS